MIPDFEVKSKIGKIFKKHNPLEEYSVRIYKIDPYFYERYEKKYKLIIMGVNIYYVELIFTLVNVLQQQKLMKKNILIEILVLRKKDKRYQKKKLGCKFIRINTSNDLDYKIGYVQTFIDKFKNIKIKKLEKQLIKEKRNERETRKI